MFAASLVIAKNNCDLFLATDKTSFYFIRHGQTDVNAGLMKEDLDVPLNKLGRKQIKEALPLIVNLDIKTICYSPLLRAVETASIINARVSAHRVQIDELKECSYKVWQEIRRMHEKKHMKQLPAFLHDFFQRVSIGLDLALQQEGAVLIVAHGGVYAALCHILNIEEGDLRVDNGELIHFYKDKCGTWHKNQLCFRGPQLVQVLQS